MTQTSTEPHTLIHSLYTEKCRNYFETYHCTKQCASSTTIATHSSRNVWELANVLHCLLPNKPSGVVYSNEHTPSSIFCMISSSWPSKIPAAQIPNVSLTCAIWSFMSDSKGEITSTVLVPIVWSFNTSAIIGKAWKIIDLPYPVCALKNISLPLKNFEELPFDRGKN